MGDVTLNAKEVTTAQKPRPVVNRELLWEGGTIKIRIPVSKDRRKQGEPFAHLQRFEQIKFLQFTRPVKGGLVNLYLHAEGDPERFYGRTVFCDVQVWKKVFGDQQVFLYIDLRHSTRQSTHKLVVIHHKCPEDYKRGVFIETPAPLGGAIALLPLVAKPAAVQPKKEETQPERISTGDRQLDRLLADGWRIESRTDCEARLLKSGGREIVHRFAKKKMQRPGNAAPQPRS